MKKTGLFLILIVFAASLSAQMPANMGDAEAQAKLKTINTTLAKLKVTFAHDSATLPEAESTEKLIRQVADAINSITSQIPAGHDLYVVGHASQPGSDEYNQALGKRRAEEVKRRLVKAGVAETAMKITSRGEKENMRAVTFSVR